MVPLDYCMDLMIYGLLYGMGFAFGLFLLGLTIHSIFKIYNKVGGR